MAFNEPGTTASNRSAAIAPSDGRPSGVSARRI